jgi:hypothetical protein
MKAMLYPHLAARTPLLQRLRRQDVCGICVAVRGAAVAAAHRAARWYLDETTRRRTTSNRLNPLAVSQVVDFPHIRASTIFSTP